MRGTRRTLAAGAGQRNGGSVMLMPAAASFRHVVRAMYWVATLAAASCAPAVAQQPPGGDNLGLELVDPKVLRVCSDPANLPFSNEKGEGFENKIAELLASKLHKNLAYTFYPGATGFVRSTLNAHLCDVILGSPQGSDIVQPTNPYYRTAYALVTRADSDLADLRSLDDPRLKAPGRRIGLVANTPPGNLLAQYGLLGAVKPYPLMVDTRFDSSSKDMIADLEKGDIDVALLWGPFAGYRAKTAAKKLIVTPIADQPGARMSFRIAFGVRRSDQNWKRELNRFIADNKNAIDAVLHDYGVPLVDEDSKSGSPAP
jgi:quinoprotein dehydrogenase-associated probable ABC transporter substrate-binding protein